ncbi:MAG TPA: MFS transporter [Gammaproteobacteria bacterium]|nr:MFS transporter [Gammaproteobacteria bacterium]
MEDRKHFFYLNLGHFLDHFFLLIFATAAALALIHDWQMSYGQLIPYSTAGFIAFGLFSLPSGWLADRWSREGMICVFFIGIGVASVGASSAQSPLGIAVWLFILGVFASIYHPVGLALIAKGGQKMGRDIAVNGVWGNMGVGFAAFMTGLMIDHVGWRAAFWLPGLISIGIGLLYFMDFRENIFIKLKVGNTSVTSETSFIGNNDGQLRRLMIRVSVIIFFTTAVSAIIFQSTTFALPKVFDERLAMISDSASATGSMALFVFAVASFAQLVVGQMLDRIGPKRVFLAVSSLQLIFFIMFAGQFGWTALFIATLFMLGAFGQIPINDYMIGKMAKSEFRASIYGVRFIVSFAVWAVVVPLISLVHQDYGFDILFYILAACALAILVAASMLPRNLPNPVPA